MSKSSDSNKEVLPEFQKFLLERKPVPEKNIPFLAYWISRFLSFQPVRSTQTDASNHELIATEYEVQRLLGQKNVETTMIYTHVLSDMSNALKSPLDALYGNM